MTTRKKSYLVVFALLLALLLRPLPGASAQGFGSVKIRAFKVGKADAFLIRTERHAILIDAAEEDDPQEILDYLKDKEISKLDLMILTHYDRGHIGGAAEVLEGIPVDLVIMPDYVKDSKWRGALSAALLKSGTSFTLLKEAKEFAFDQLSLQVYPAKAAAHAGEEDDDFSLVTRVTHGDNNFLFTGDINSARMDEMMAGGMDLKSDLLQLPEHGRSRGSTEAFIRAASPKYALITCSDKNPPAGAVLALLYQLGAQVYLTRDGGITLTSDGYSLTFKQ